jgi:hypothetical protein
MTAGVLEPGDPFSDRVRAELDAMTPAARAPFDALLGHAVRATGAKPSAKWLQGVDPLARAIGDGPLEEVLVRWFGLVERPPGRSREGARATSPEPGLSEHTGDVVRGLVCIASRFATPRMASALGDLANLCFRKVPGYGAMSSKVGNACLWSLGAMSGTTISGVAQLGRLKVRVRYAQALKLVDKALAEAAARAGLTSEELLELGVPTCGLDADGVSEEEIAGAIARISLSDGAPKLEWIRRDGAKQASVPAEIKGGHAEELKALKARMKDIETLLPAQALRLEQMMSEPREIAIADFEERYLQHGLVAQVARRLVWWLGSTAAMFVDGALVDASGKRVDLATVTHARLWHPLGRPPAEVLAWRTFLAERGVTQPFKQAHREIYVLTDAELATHTYSNRFAAHVLKQHQLAALLRERGWTYTLQGGWDSANTPRKRLRHVGLTAELLVEAAFGSDELSEGGIYLYVTTDQVRFIRDDGTPAPLDQVPALVFSETMRDVDLFVGVTSVGNDPRWRDGGPAAGRGYWESYAFGDLGASAETRRAVLETLLPRLKIRDRVRLEGRFLHVRGDLRSYKIHLGSTNILMEPNDQYLCIVPDRSATAASVTLPFEGDTALSLVLSKALLLVADAKIQDETILRQIRGSA